MRQLVNAWADQNKVDVELEFITGSGGQDLATLAAEAHARTGHDIRCFPIWTVHQYADHLEPMDDVMQRLTAKYGAVSAISAYLAKAGGTWRAVPSSVMSKNMASCARLDVFKQQCGVDVQAMYPGPCRSHAGVRSVELGQSAADCRQVPGGRNAAGLTLSNNGDAVDWCGSLFAGFGAQLVDPKGNITVRSDNVRQVLEYAQKLAKFVDPGVYGWDGAGNNRALISGKSALIFDAPSAWSVAKTDAPHVAENCWEFPNPKGSAGRFVPYNQQNLDFGRSRKTRAPPRT